MTFYVYPIPDTKMFYHSNLRFTIVLLLNVYTAHTNFFTNSTKTPYLLKVTHSLQCQHNANHLSLCQYSQYCMSNMERGILRLMHVSLFAVVWLSQQEQVSSLWKRNDHVSSYCAGADGSFGIQRGQPTVSTAAGRYFLLSGMLMFY